MLIGKGQEKGKLSNDESRAIIAGLLEEARIGGKSVLVVIPDATRTAPVPFFFRTLCDLAAGRAKRLDFLVALGTHPPLSQEALEALVGITDDEARKKYAAHQLLNHRWDLPETFVELGRLTRDEVRELTGGQLEVEVPVAINKLALEYDLLLICGPVFPHEVVGFSGGNKYLFPGIGSREFLNLFHWLGALITNPKIVGTKKTPVRATVDRAAAMLPTARRALCMVVAPGGDLAGLYAGEPEEAWSSAADLSDKLHIVYKEQPFASVLSCAPEMYDDIWTAGKCMYKLEPVVADGGELIIYAPHVREFSVTHGKVLDEVGYHTRDYFAGQWDKFKNFPWGVLAHSTHVRGIGTYENGVEKCRVQVTLATQIPEDVCRRMNLGWRDPKSIDPEEWQEKEDEGRLYVPHAGEMLYRLKDPPEWAKG